MEFRTLAKTDLKVSRLSMGTMTFGGQVAEDESIRMVDHCLDLGINFFDTANVYNEGRAEMVLGAALRGRRHKVVLATKVCGRMGEEPDDAGLTRAAMRKAVEGSLRRLATDYIDVYYLHMPDGNTRLEETLAAMEDLVQAGKVRHPATSNYASWQVLQMLWHCENHACQPPAVSQQMYNLLARGIEQEYLAFCREFAVSLIAYNPLAGGVLTGKHRQEKAPEPGTRFDRMPFYRERYWHPASFEALGELAGIAKRCKLSLIELSLRWLLAQPLVDSVILGAASMTQLEENLKACQGPPPSEEALAACDAVWEKQRGCVAKYNR